MEKQLKFPLEIQFFAEDNNPNETVNLDEVDGDPNQGNQVPPNENNPAEAGNPPEQQGQSRSDNTRYAEMRRKAEKLAKEKAEKENQERTQRLQQESFNQGRINALGGVNPYTKQPIKTAYDLKMYDIMKKLDDQGTAPTLENVMLELSKEENDKLEAEQMKAKQEQEKQAYLDKSKKELAEKYPQCDQAWIDKTIAENKVFRCLLTDGHSLLEAVELLGIQPQETPPNRESTPSPTPSGITPPKKSIKDMTSDEYEAYAIEHHGSL